MGRGDNTHVHLHRRITAHAVKLPVGQHAQQTGLNVQRHIADLIQEQRAAVSLFEAPLANGICAGKRPFFVPEQFGFNQVLRDRRHIQGDKRRFCPRAVAMQGMGHKLFTGPRFAVDQDADGGAGQTANNAKYVLHRRRFADDVGGWPKIGRVARLLLLLIMANRALNQRHRFVDIKRFGQVIKRPLLIGAHCGIQIGVRGHYDDRKHRVALFDLL